MKRERDRLRGGNDDCVMNHISDGLPTGDLLPEN